MSLPLSAQFLISEYAKPITRPDWRKGSSCNSAFKFCPIMIQTHKYMHKKLKMLNIETEHNTSLADDIKMLGERLFIYYRYDIEYDNFYFYLCSEDNALFNKIPILKKTKFKNQYFL